MDWPSGIRTLDFAAGSLTVRDGQSVVGSSNAWPLANLAIFVPVRVPLTVTVCKMATASGATAAGNFDIGIYDIAGNRLVSSGATAKGNGVEHIIDVTDTQIGPGLYYWAMAADGTNNYILGTPSGTSPVPVNKLRMLGLMEATSSYPLPTTVTFAATSNNTVMPAIAAYLRPY